MERSIYNKLIEWKNKQNHKPLILNGARQVGKTYIIKEFGNHARPISCKNSEKENIKSLHSSVSTEIRRQQKCLTKAAQLLIY